MSDYERAVLRLRLATGRRHKANAGGYAYGAPPFGSPLRWWPAGAPPLGATASSHLRGRLAPSCTGSLVGHVPRTHPNSTAEVPLRGSTLFNTLLVPQLAAALGVSERTVTGALGRSPATRR